MDMMYNCIMALFSPLTALFSIATKSYLQAEEATTAIELTILKVPSGIVRFSMTLLRKIGFGVLAAMLASVVSVVLMLLAVTLGVGLVQVWVEEPAFVKERLFFDYTNVNPTAVFTFGGVDHGIFKMKSPMRIPVGHTCQVSLLLLLPESDYNMHIGMFQLTAEVVSENGNVKSKSSKPCMLRFRSLPIRLLRTSIMGAPLLLGISEETQKISVDMVKYKEGYPRTKALKFTLISRAGNSHLLPQLYEAEILLKSQLPWTKEFVRKWKWTCCVWISLYIYIIMLVILLSCCIFLLATSNVRHYYHEGGDAAGDGNAQGFEKERINEERRDEREIAELLSKWHQRRKKRKISSFDGREGLEERDQQVCSSASTMSLTREETSGDVAEEEDIEDSESAICYASETD